MISLFPCSLAMRNALLSSSCVIATRPKPQGFARMDDVGKDNSHAARPCGLALIQYAIGD
jgi:hypothetical protein